MTTSTFFVYHIHSSDPLFIARVNNAIIKQYEKHLKGQHLKINPAPSFVFDENKELPKFSIDSKKDF